MKNGKKFMKGCKMPHPPPSGRFCIGRTPVILSRFTASIYPAYRSYRSNTLAIYPQYAGTICPIIT